MHQEILSAAQLELLPLLKRFSKKFFLAGGTAIALHIGHRRSLDFDLFSSTPFRNTAIKNAVLDSGFHKIQLLYEDGGQLDLAVNGIKITFLHFPFNIPHKVNFRPFITLPSLNDLAAMKAYALGRRGKWKDYVDLFTIFNNHLPFNDVVNRTGELFGGAWNEKLFRGQLCYFDDIDYSEAVDYVGEAWPDELVRSELTRLATDWF